MIHLNINIIGKVQGVWFRVSTKDIADSLGVKGFVKNEKDGSVYIEAEAPNEIMNDFVEWCKKGPKNALVTEVKVNEGEINFFQDFYIIR
jgi:acylphosphatase